METQVGVLREQMMSASTLEAEVPSEQSLLGMPGFMMGRRFIPGGRGPLSRVGFSGSRLGSSSRLPPALLLPPTFFLLLFAFPVGLLARGQFAGPRLRQETPYRTVLVLEQGDQDQPQALPKTTREAWPRLLGGRASGNMLLRQGLQPATCLSCLRLPSHAHHP